VARKTDEAQVSLAALKRELAEAEDPHRAFISQSFFKTGKGEYGEGDVFLGLTVPAQRKLAKMYRTLPLAAIQSLLKSKIHGHRLVALLILVDQYTRGDANTKDGLFAFYLVNAKRVNNWDLVDSSAPYIVGAHLLTCSRKLLRDLAKSDNLWERRIAIVSTLWLIRAGELDETFTVSKLLLKTNTISSTKPLAGCCARPARNRRTGCVDSLPSTTVGCRARHSATRSNAFRRASASSGCGALSLTD
jgi:3-methyladenine DNA glycosylase AlkD